MFHGHQVAKVRVGYGCRRPEALHILSEHASDVSKEIGNGYNSCKVLGFGGTVDL